MMNNVLIIGNGFDLDLGLPTSYIDFAKSSFWPQPTHSIASSPVPNTGTHHIGHRPHPILLEHVLSRKSNLPTWFDLEMELLQYAKVDNKSNGPESEYFINNNIDYYNRLREGLCNYILEVENQKINTESVAAEVLKHIIYSGTFTKIYSFNYTNLRKILNALNISDEIKYSHIHGCVKEKSVILGVDESNLRAGYKDFHKTSSPFFKSYDIYNALKSAQEIVFFGLSFGKIDFSYFSDFFKELLKNPSLPEERKQNITIFTRDSSSQSEIKKNLREQDINVQKIYGHSHLCFIGTKDGTNRSDLKEFYDRHNLDI